MAVAVAGATLHDPPDDATDLAIRWFVAAIVLASGIGLFAGFRGAFWTSMVFLGLFGLVGVFDAMEDRDASSIAVATVLVVAFLLLWLRRPGHVEEAPTRAGHRPMRVEGMTPSNRFLYVAGSLAFGILGLTVAIVGRGPDRVLGIFIALFFGSGGIAMLGLLRPQPRGRTAEIGFVSHDRMPTPALLFPASRKRLALAFVATLAWAVAGILLAMNADDLAGLGSPRHPPPVLRVLGIAMVIIFGAFAVGSFLSLFRRMFVALVSEGILLRTRSGALLVPWDAITEVGIASLRGSPYFGVNVADPAAVQGNRWARWWLETRVNRRLTRFDLTYPGTLLATPVEHLERMVVYYLEHPGDRVTIGSSTPPR
jgi:hypothetical protein